jgi:hypothetical protein
VDIVLICVIVFTVLCIVYDLFCVFLLMEFSRDVFSYPLVSVSLDLLRKK